MKALIPKYSTHVTRALHGAGAGTWTSHVKMKYQIQYDMDMLSILKYLSWNKAFLH